MNILVITAFLFVSDISYAQTQYDYYDRGVVKIQKGSYKEAIEDFTGSMMLYPDYLPAYYQRGFTYYLLNDHMNAIRDYDKFIDLLQDEKGFYYYQAFYHRGTSKCRMGNYRGCIADLEVALETYANKNSWTYLKLGRAEHNIGQYEQAVLHFSEAIDKANEKTTLALRSLMFESRGMSLIELGEIVQGCNDLFKARGIEAMWLGGMGLINQFSDYIEEYCEK